MLAAPSCESETAIQFRQLAGVTHSDPAPAQIRVREWHDACNICRRSRSSDDDCSSRRERQWWRVAKKQAVKSRPGGSPHPKRRMTAPGKTSKTTISPDSAATLALPGAEESAEGNPSHIVGIGASAGGLEAFTELLSHLPVDTGMAFVLIQHLDPTHESHLTELLAKASKMPVSEVKGGTRAEANHVYVIPSRCNLGISNGVLHTPPPPAEWPQSADRFLSPCAGGRPRQQGHRRGSVGNRIRWDVGAPGDQGRGRRHLRSGNAKPRSSTACRKAPSPRVRWIMFSRRPESRGNWRPWRAIPGFRRNLRRRLSRRGMRNWPGYSGWCGAPREWTSRTTSTAPWRGASSGAWPSADSKRWKPTAAISSGTARKPTRLCENCLITVTAFFREPAVFEELKKDGISRSG